MPSKRAAKPSNAYQIKITLRGSKPPIWRRFVVPDDLSLAELHHVIQEIMGWHDGHLHAFVIDGVSYTAQSKYGMDLEIDGEDEEQFRLGDVVRNAKQKFRNEYDFGDGWEHTLLVEKFLPADQNPRIFTRLAGKGRCPPGRLRRNLGILRLARNPGRSQKPRT